MPNPASKLEPFRDFIAAERRKNTTYRRIAELLAEKGIEVDYSTIHAFVKVRSKPRRKVITMWEPQDTDAAPPPPISVHSAEAPQTHGTSKTPAEGAGQSDAIRRFKEAKPGKPQSAEGLPSFKDDAPLEQLSDEEARRLRDEL